MSTPTPAPIEVQIYVNDDISNITRKYSNVFYKTSAVFAGLGYIDSWVYHHRNQREFAPNTPLVKPFESSRREMWMVARTGYIAAGLFTVGFLLKRISNHYKAKNENLNKLN
jgi:hypothetical protein